MEAIKTVIEQIKKPEQIGIFRPFYGPYDMEIAMNVIRRIGKSFDDRFIIDNENRIFYEQMIKWFHGDKDFKGDLNKGIAVLGSVGSGKTLAMRIFQVYRKIDNIKFLIDGRHLPLDYKIIRTADIIVEYQMKGPENTDFYKTRRVICFDDFGEEMKKVLHYGNEINVMTDIMEVRYTRLQLTLLTSNYKVENISGMYGERIESRFAEMFNVLILKGKDRRK